MSISTGTLLDHYRLAEQIGEGGMGVVWRAVDTTLDREVAVKILPEAFCADPERLTRFRQEAKLLASLNHPNIATVHGFHEAEGTHFLVMELLGGESVAERLGRQGALVVEEATAIARQVAMALEAAHSQGIVHRDLKPANVQIDDEGRAKVLDFGLAKAMPAAVSGPSGSAGLSQSPTMTSDGTMPGLILGTAAYMSPEQARGQAVDRRTDIWAFGCVLFEMLTGSAAFGGDTFSDTLVSILQHQPDLDDLPESTPRPVRRLLGHCLEKDRAKRLRDAGDVLLFLDAEEDEGDVDASVDDLGRPSAVWKLAAAALLGLALGVAAMWWRAPELPTAAVRKFEIALDGAHLGFAGAPGVLSPDGSKVAYVSTSSLYVRAFDELTPRRLDVGEQIRQGEKIGRTSLFWSPDGEWLGFNHDGQLWKAPLDGGRPVSICTVPETGETLGVTWDRDDRITFAVWRGSMYSVSAQGGQPEMLLRADHETIVDFHRVESLPDGSLIFGTHPADPEAEERGGISRLVEGEQSSIISDRGAGNAVYSPTGHMLYNRFGGGAPSVMAVPYSVSKGAVIGEPFQVATNAFGPSVSVDGTLVYGSAEGADLFELARVDREGRVLGSIGRPVPGLGYPALSPDGSEVVFSAIVDDEMDLWVLDLADGSRRRLTFEDRGGGQGEERAPAWSADGETIVFSRLLNLRPELIALAADGSGAERTIAAGLQPDWSADGRFLVFAQHDLDGDDDLWVLDLGSESDLEAATSSAVLEADDIDTNSGKISPDGRYLAFQQGQGPGSNVFLTSFPSGSGRWQVSTGGGGLPRWSPDGSRLYFLDSGADLFEVKVETEPEMRLGEPARLFANGANGIDLSRHFAVARDGSFLVAKRVAGEGGRRFVLVVVQNWLQEFQR
jgi:Tol biopolymer transport system component